MIRVILIVAASALALSGCAPMLIGAAGGFVGYEYAKHHHHHCDVRGHHVVCWR